MKTLFPNFCTLLLLTLSTSGQVGATAPTHPTRTTKVTPTADEELFTKLIGEVSASIEHKDMNALGELMASDYVHYSPDGGTGHKANELTYLATWPPTTIKLVGLVKVSRAGDMAVTVSRNLYSVTENGKTTNRTMQHMIAWTLRDGKWQMAIVQSKPVSA